MHMQMGLPPAQGLTLAKKMLACTRSSMRSISTYERSVILRTQ